MQVLTGCIRKDKIHGRERERGAIVFAVVGFARLNAMTDAQLCVGR